MKFTHKLALTFLVLYAGSLTADRIYRMGEDSGIKQGFPAGVKTGIERGRNQACMTKPI